jgi:hypothetical protein
VHLRFWLGDWNEQPVRTRAPLPPQHALLNAAGDVMLLVAVYAIIAAIASSLRDKEVEALDEPIESAT